MYFLLYTKPNAFYFDLILTSLSGAYTLKWSNNYRFYHNYIISDGTNYLLKELSSLTDPDHIDWMYGLYVYSLYSFDLDTCIVILSYYYIGSNING